jgi:hypothetical protein
MSTILDRMLAAVPGEPERFRSTAEAVTDWMGVVEAAAGEGVLGVLRRELGRSGIALPPPARRLMDRVHASEALWQAHVARSLDAALGALERRGVPAAVLKGPPLAERLYPDLSLRCSTDIDILVAEADTERAVAALEPLGYVEEPEPAAAYARRHHHHLHLFGPRPPVIELHFRAYVGFGVTMPAEDLLDRARLHRTAGGARCLVLSPEDEILYLAVHAAGHCCDRLLWLYDLKLLLARETGLDWERMAARARAVGVMAAFALTMSVLERRLGMVRPAAVTPAPARLRRHLIGRLVDGRMRAPARGPLLTLRHLLVMTALCDRPAAGARFARHHVARIARRRVQGWLPALAPREWAA